MLYSGIRYPCSNCNYKATDPGHLKTHINAKHLGMRFYCTQCPDRPSFTQQTDLKKHTNAKHLGVTALTVTTNLPRLVILPNILTPKI